MALCDIKYICQDCGKESSKENRRMICEFCGGRKQGIGGFSIIGSRDNFGIKNAFVDDSTGKTIDNYSSWEKAGYRQSRDVIQDKNMKSKVKQKIDKKIRGY